MFIIIAALWANGYSYCNETFHIYIGTNTVIILNLLGGSTMQRGTGHVYHAWPGATC